MLPKHRNVIATQKDQYKRGTQPTVAYRNNKNLHKSEIIREVVHLSIYRIQVGVQIRYYDTTPDSI